MLYVISPAKSLDYDTPVPEAAAARATRPHFAEQAAELTALMRGKSPGDVAALMDLSAELAELNVRRYAAWRPRHTAHNSRPAVYAFDGDVYGGLQARTLDAADIDWAQQHLAILSGLYGVLRPLDRLQPYRLEMGTALAGPHGRDLYAYWGDTIARHLRRAARAAGTDTLVNLASQEYFRAVDRRRLGLRVVECVFEDWKGGGYKIISFFAKRARGLMARHAIVRRATRVEDLLGFDAEGWRFDPGASDTDRLVFRRKMEG